MDTQNSEMINTEVESQPKDVWQAPVLTRVEIKQTLSSGGKYSDASVGTTLPPPA